MHRCLTFRLQQLQDFVAGLAIQIATASLQQIKRMLRDLDRTQRRGYLWFETCITASYLGIAARVVSP